MKILMFASAFVAFRLLLIVLFHVSIVRGLRSHNFATTFYWAFKFVLNASLFHGITHLFG